MLVRKSGPGSEIAAREGASPSIACTRQMTAMSMKVAGVSVHCTIMMKALAIQPIGGRRHSGRTFQATLETKCPQETCWGTGVLAGGLREQLDLLKRWACRIFWILLSEVDLLDIRILRTGDLEMPVPDVILKFCFWYKIPILVSGPYICLT